MSEQPTIFDNWNDLKIGNNLYQCPTCFGWYRSGDAHYCPGAPWHPYPLNFSITITTTPSLMTKTENPDRLDLDSDSKNRINIYIDGTYVGQIWVDEEHGVMFRKEAGEE